MKRYLLILLLLCCTITYGQSAKPKWIDTVVRKLPAMHNDTNKLSHLKDLAIYYQNASIDTDLLYCRQGLKIAEALKNITYTCNFHYLIAQAYMAQSNFKKALSELDAGYTIALANHDKRLMASACCDYGLVYENTGDYIKAEKYLIQCLTLAEQGNNYKMAATGAVNVGTIFANQNNNEKAVYYAQMCLDLLKKHHLTLPIPECKAYELLATTYFKQGNVKDARTNILKALTVYQEQKYDIGVAICYSYLATFYPSDYVQELSYGLKANAIWAKMAPDNFYAIGNYSSLGSAYKNLVISNQWKIIKDSIPLAIRKNTYLKKSRQYFLQGINMAKATSSKYYVMTLSDSLARLDAVTGQYKEAFDNLQQRNKLYDSIYSQDNKNKIAGIEEKHEVSLRDKQLQINRLQIANQHEHAILLVGLIMVLIGISGVIYWQSQNRKRTNATLLALNTQLDEANRVKMKFFSILNHDLKQPVAGFVNMIHLQKNEPDLLNEATREKYQDKIAQSAENLLEKMEDLLLWAKGQMDNFTPQIKPIPVAGLFKHIGHFFENSGVQIEFKSPPGMLLQTDEYCIKAITQNLTGNAIKALAKTTSPLIVWAAWETSGKKYLSITDNGPGATNQQLKAFYDDSATIGIQHGLGLHIVRDMAKAIGCTISVVPGNNAGLKIQLEMS